MGEEDIKVFVVLKRGKSLTASEIREHCSTCMAKYMIPAHVVFLDDIPRTPTGKPEKGKLATMSAE